MVDVLFYGLSELHFLVWRFFYPTLDRYIIRQRENLKTDLNAMIEEKGPELFGSKEAFERKRVLKDGAVSLKRIKTVLSLSAFLPDPLNIGELTQDIFSQILFYLCLLALLLSCQRSYFTIFRRRLGPASITPIVLC